MQEEIIIIQQKITITYNNEKARQLALGRLLHDTNWVFASQGTLTEENEQFTLQKGEISIPFQK
jgi:hypothetical protein